MSRKRIPGRNSGDKYSNEEYNNIFQWVIRGKSSENIGRILGRTPSEIEKAWRRICRDAGEYDNERIYNLWPIDERGVGFNGRLKEYIRIQYTKTKRSKEGYPPTAKKLSKITNVLEKRIQQFIDENNKWIKKNELNIFNKIGA